MRKPDLVIALSFQNVARIQPKIPSHRRFQVDGFRQRLEFLFFLCRKLISQATVQLFLVWLYSYT